MREKLSLMIMEGPGKEVAVELFKDGPKALEAFNNLKGMPGDAPTRATFLLIDYDKGSVVHFDVKDLPVPRDPDDEPWGHRLGEGPIEDPGKSSDGAGNSG